MSLEDIAAKVAEEVALELLKAAVAHGGDAIRSILDRGTIANDSPIAGRVRDMLAEESESRRAARAVADASSP